VQRPADGPPPRGGDGADAANGADRNDGVRALSPAFGEPYSRVPKERYTSPDWAALERERLWPRVWQMACREEDVPNVGDYVEYELGDVSILVVRSGRRTLKAFFNSCLHRGTRLRSGCGTAEELRCPFHGWCWALDGTNLEVVDQHDFPGLDPATLRLPECRIDTWGGFVFVNLDPAAPPLETFLAQLVPQVAPYRLADMRIMAWRTVEVPANWKTVVDAFNETYHLFGTHLDSIVGSDDVNTSYELFPPHGRMVTRVGIPSPRIDRRDTGHMMSEMVGALLAIQKVTPDQLAYLKLLRDGEIALPDGVTVQQVFAQMSRARLNQRGYDSPDLSNEQYGENWNFYLFPNMLFNILPGEFYGFRVRPGGDDPNTCWFDEISLRFPEPGYRQRGHETVAWNDDHDAREATWGHILNQDFTNMPEVQRGLRAGGARHVYFSGYQESRIVTMHRELDRYLLDGTHDEFERVASVDHRAEGPADGRADRPADGPAGSAGQGAAADPLVRSGPR
jgi:phenylpropionate dioxygenase-like ring-hydroxylating dioxygenase large terminal subunit